MNRVRDLENLMLVDPVGRGVGDHEGGKVLPCGGNLRAQIVEVDVAGIVTGHHNDLHARQHSTRSIRAVRTGGNQAGGAVGIAVGEMEAANGQQARQFALATGVGL